MATVVGTDQSAIKRVTCRNCASIVEYVPADTQESKSYDYGGGCDIVRWLPCPKCRCEITVSRS